MGRSGFEEEESDIPEHLELSYKMIIIIIKQIKKIKICVCFLQGSDSSQDRDRGQACFIVCWSHMPAGSSVGAHGTLAVYIQSM